MTKKDRKELQYSNVGEIEAGVVVKGKPFWQRIKGVMLGGETADLGQTRQTDTVFARNSTTGETGFVSGREARQQGIDTESLPEISSQEAEFLDDEDRNDERGKRYRQAAYGSSSPVVNAEPNSDPRRTTTELGLKEGGWGSQQERERTLRSRSKKSLKEKLLPWF